MKNKVVVIMPVILVWIFVIIGCVMLPRKPSESDEEKKEKE